jgi:hypothetical protein
MARRKKVTSYQAELWQDGVMVAAVDAPTLDECNREIEHYAMMYRQDGPVQIKRKHRETRP